MTATVLSSFALGAVLGQPNHDPMIFAAVVLTVLLGGYAAGDAFSDPLPGRLSGSDLAERIDSDKPDLKPLANLLRSRGRNCFRTEAASEGFDSIDRILANHNEGALVVEQRHGEPEGTLDLKNEPGGEVFVHYIHVGSEQLAKLHNTTSE